VEEKDEVKETTEKNEEQTKEKENKETTISEQLVRWREESRSS